MSVQLLEKSSELIDEANKAQTSQGLQIQTYCQSVKSQPNVDFSGYPTLKKYEEKINTGLGRAQAHADAYLNVIQPNILKNISNISNYYSLHNAIPTTLPETATKEQWLEALAALQNMAAEYHGTAIATATSLSGLYNNLAQDTATFEQTVLDLQTAVNGNKGVLQDIEKQLTDIESQIQGTIAGIVISGLAIVGGVFITAVGSIAGFVTAGTSTPLVILGVGIIVGGIGGAIGTALKLKGLYDIKAKLLTDKTKLAAEVELALGISQGFSTLKTQVCTATTAAQQMANAWEFLGSDLNHLSENLKKGIQSTHNLRTVFLKTANSTLQGQVIKDITAIKEQMTGVRQFRIVPNSNMNSTIDKLVEEARKVPLVA